LENVLINDRQVASMVSMSTGWVRNQRWRRKHGEDHVLNIDPVMIGAAPRYRSEDVIGWIDTLGATNDG
jgi:hypothetical protein